MAATTHPKRYKLQNVRRHNGYIIGEIIDEDTTMPIVSGRITDVLNSARRNGLQLTNQDDVERLLDRAA